MIDDTWRSCESAVAMNLSGVKQALKAYKAARNAETVSDAEAMRRARICANNCPMNRKVTGFIGRTSQVLGASSDTGQVPPELADRKCGVCGCSLLLLIPALPANLHRDDAIEQGQRAKKAPNCWLPDAVKNS